MFRYIGNGSFIPGYPARDMGDDELPLYDLDAAIMLASGLYEYEEPEFEVYEEDDPIIFFDDYDEIDDLCDDCYNCECEDEED